MCGHDFLYTKTGLLERNQAPIKCYYFQQMNAYAERCKKSVFSL